MQVKGEPPFRSPTRSFIGWKLIRWVKGRRKIIIALIGGAIGYRTTNSVIISAGSALIFEGIISLIEYYFKEVKVKN